MGEILLQNCQPPKMQTSWKYFFQQKEIEVECKQNEEKQMQIKLSKINRTGQMGIFG